MRDQRAQPSFGGIDGLERHSVDSAVFAGLEVNDLFFFFAACAVEPVETAFAFPPGGTFCNQPRKQGKISGHLHVGICLRQCKAQRRIDMRLQVQPDDVEQIEYAGLWEAAWLAHDCIRFFDGQSQAARRIDCALDPEDANAIGDEARRVLRSHDHLAEFQVGELSHGGNGLGPRLRPGHDFQQTHVARRVEEMRDAEILLHRNGHAVHQNMEWQGRCVGRHNRAIFAEWLDFPVESLLCFDLFRDRLNDPVARRQASEIILDIADFNQLQRRL